MAFAGCCLLSMEYPCYFFFYCFHLHQSYQTISARSSYRRFFGSFVGISDLVGL